MNVWATTDKAGVAAQQARVLEVFEAAMRRLDLVPRTIAVTYAPMAKGERAVKIQVDCVGETTGGRADEC